MEFFKIFIVVGAVLVSTGDSIKNYDLCEKGDITVSNSTKISFNFASVGSDAGNSTCERIIYTPRQRLVLTLNTSVGNSSDLLQITDGAFGGQTINPTSSETGKIYKSTGNSMRIILKVKSALKESSLGYIEGTFTALPFHATCGCSGIQNGHVRCRDGYLERKCTVHCRKDYVDLFKTIGNFTCNLVKGKWNKEYQNAVGCIQTPSIPDVMLQVNFTSEKNMCNETLKNNIYEAIFKYLFSQDAIKENSVCFKSNFSHCFQYSCDKRDNKTFVVVNIHDNATGRWYMKGNNKALFNVYNNTNWIKLTVDILHSTQNESTITKDNVESKVSTKCRNGTFEILSQFTCSKCPPGAFYKSSTRTCEKCPNGIISSEVSTECLRKTLLPQSDACDITCMAGKELDKNLEFCQWCRLDMYRNISDAAENCTLCPNGKRTLYRGSSNVDDCHIPCNEGTFFDVKVKSCVLCPLGTYQNGTSHLFSWCNPCESGKVTYKEGRKDLSECFQVCKRGHFFNNKTRNCTKCPVGTYQNSTKQMSCQKCPTGTTTLSAGSYLSSECTEMCQEGNYFNATFMACLNCSLGTYLDKSNHMQRACIKCESNKTTYVKGAVSNTQCLEACSPGQYLNFSQSVCVKCEIGSYQNNERQLQCIRCPEGSLTRTIGSTEASNCIKACLNGTFFDAQNSSCLDCPLGTYMAKRGHIDTHCTECGDKKTTYVKGSSDSSQCFPKCKVGQYFDTTLSSCKECALGFYQMKPEQLSCSECPPGLNTTRTGTTSSLGCVKIKVLCDQGEFYDPKSEECHLCEYGTYQSAENHNLTSCQSCLSGRTKGKGAQNVSDCIEGCNSFPCRNGAQCTETKHVFACHCPNGITGQYCDVFENKDKLQKIEESVRFTSLTWSTALENASSTQYKEVSYKIERALRESVFEKHDGFVLVQVTKLLSGSVIAEFDIYFNESTSVDPANLRQSLRSAIEQGSIGGLSVDPSFPKVPTEKPEKPSAANTSPNVNAIKDEKDEYAWGQYLGIGFGLIMAIVIGVSCFMWWRSSKKKKQKEDTPLVLTRFQDGSYREMPKEDEEDDAVKIISPYNCKMSSSSDNSLPYLPDNDSPGSSVSSSLQKEYDELLKYAVVTPRLQIGENVYERKVETQPSNKLDNHVRFSDASVNSSSNSEYKPSVSDTTQSTYSEELSYVAREGVVALPNSPVVHPASISLIGQGSLARDSLLKDASDTPNEKEKQSSNDDSPSADSPSSDQSVDSPMNGQRSPTIDADLARMEALLDSWCLDLKRNVLAELAQCKMGLFEKQKQLILQEKRRHHADRNKLLNEMESQKELLYTYEESIKHKDSIVANVTGALQRQRDKFELLRGFSQWKIKHSDETREAFTSKLSDKHYNHTMQAKAWRSWRNLIESKWKQRVEKACQSKSQEVCIKLTEDYETKLENVSMELEKARQEIARLHAEREAYEETMKKAFMRGVCALNLEAMTMFREGEEGGRNAVCTETTSSSDEIPRFQAPRPVCTTTGVTPGQSSVSTSQSAIPYKPASIAGVKRILTVKATGREDLKGAKGGAGLVGHQGPVSSILVHRHTSKDNELPSQPPKPKQPSTASMRTSKSRPLPVKTVHSTPLKVVH